MEEGLATGPIPPVVPTTVDLNEMIARAVEAQRIAQEAAIRRALTGQTGEQFLP